MRISDDVIEKVLQQGGVIDESQLAQLKLLAEHSHTSLYNIVFTLYCQYFRVNPYFVILHNSSENFLICQGI